MALDTYTNLRTAVADWANRTDLTNQIVDFIRLAEARFARHPACEDERQGTLTLDSTNVALGSDVRTVESLWYDDGTRYGPLDKETPERMAELKAIQGPLTGAPERFAVIKNGTEVLCSPDPASGSFVVQMLYNAQLELLADAASGKNWILTDHPDLYLFGALLEVAPFLKNQEDIPVWQGKFDRGMAELDALVERRKYSGRLVAIPKRAIG